MLIVGSIYLSFLMVVLSSVEVRAEDVSGTWVSRVSGEGYVDVTAPATFHYDVELTLSQSGSTVSGRIRTTLKKIDEHMEGWTDPNSIGRQDTYSVSGKVNGSSFVMIIVSSGETFTFKLHVSSNKMTGSGSYVSAGITNNWKFDLVKEGLLSGLGLPYEDLRYPMSVIAFVMGGITILVSFIPGPKHTVRQVTHVTTVDTPRFVPGAPISPIEHLGTPFDLPRGAKPFPKDMKVIQIPQKYEALDVFQHAPCPYCGTTLVYTMGSYYCPNPNCKQNQ